MSETALPPEDKEMTLVQHLLDLKTSLTRGILAIIVFFLVLFPFANEIYVYISEPLTRYLPPETSMIATGVASPFLTPFKLSFVLAIYLAMPYLLYQLWRFIAPALYTHEKQLIGPILFFSSFLFYAGGAFAYYVVFPLVFGFLSTAAPDGVTVATDIAAYLDFVIKMFFAFGMAFEVPIVTVLLILTGMTKPEKLKHARPYIIVGAFVIGMLLTPPDIISQTLLAVPMWLLFELGLVVGAYVLKRRGIKDEEESDDNNPEPSSPQPNRTTVSEPQSMAPATGSLQEFAAREEAKTQGKPQPNPVPDNIQFDNRYDDQKDDDMDWDAEFDKIDSQMNQLEKEYQARKKAEEEAAKKAQHQADGLKDEEDVSVIQSKKPDHSDSTMQDDVKEKPNEKTTEKTTDKTS